MRKIFSILTAFALALFSYAQSDTARIDSIHKRIFLVGDAGEFNGNQIEVIAWMSNNIDWNNEKNHVIFLGDNIYEWGMPDVGDASYDYAKSVIDYQINLVKGKNATAYFIPGNHDWNNGKIGGVDRVQNQVNYINSLELPNVQAWPLNGCPGPIEVDLGEKIVLVLLDSQWWLHLHEKPGPESYCEFKTQDDIVTALKEIAAVHQDQLMIVAMHHPLYSYSVHGGNYTLRHHIFPLTEIVPWLYLPMPVLGSVYPVARGIFGNIQDVNHPLYRTMRQAIEEVLEQHPNAIHVAGHDHSLQLLIKDSIPFIISGSGAKSTRVKGGRYTQFADARQGFAVLEVRKSGKVESKFYTLNSADYNNPLYTKVLKQIVPAEKLTIIDSLREFPDSILVAGNEKLASGGMGKFLFGRNYREEWITPVKAPILDITTELGGLVPTERGGGRQTKSLRVEDSTGKEYVLRSIEKFPEAAIPADLRRTFAKDIVEEGVSASYPYASLSYAPLARALNIPVLRRKLVYIPDDPLLGRFRIDFANSLAVLEEREPEGTTKTYNSEDLVLRLLKDHDDHIDQDLVLNARLLDNFVMDFDRHEDQWRWATYDTGKGKMYYPIPRDHDQMFFVNEGVIPKFARKPWFIPQIQGFKSRAQDIRTFNFAARNFDRAFLSELDEKQWSEKIDTFLAKMDKPVIEQALARQPDEIEHFSRDKIVNTLNERKKYFKGEMLEYYRFISKIVNVVGSNQDELFTITRNNDGTVLVQVNTIKKEGPSSLIYERLFDPGVTKEVRVYGMGSDDRFVFKGSSNRQIKVRVIGGAGNDEFNNEGGDAGNTIIYDVKYEENKFTGNNNLKKRVNADPTNNKYDRLYYKYDILHPDLGIGFNVDDGLYLGGRVRFTGHGFRKEPYAQLHDLRIIYAIGTKAWNFRYNAEFISALGRADLVINSDIKAPNNTTNFFGLGNETVFDESMQGGKRFYRARFNKGDVAIMVRHRLQSWMDVTYGPSFQYYSINPDDNKNRILFQPSLFGLDSARVYRKKMYAGGQIGMVIDTRNNDILPTRGLHLQTGARGLWGIKNDNGLLTQLNYDMALFISIVEETKIVFGTRFGVGHNLGDFEFFQAQYLSGLENLRGYRKDRFAGKSMMYFNNDLRFKITDFNTYLFPGSLGILAFFDVGRVWMKNDSSTDWHVGYGGGIWISPLRRVVASLSLAHSKDESLIPYAKLGFQF